MGRASTTRVSPSRISATWARLRVRFSLAPARSASSATTMAPALWRLLPYSSSGLPSPSTIQGPPSGPAPVIVVRLRSWSGTGRLALGPVLALAGVLGGGAVATLGGLALLALGDLGLGLDRRRGHGHDHGLGVVEDDGAAGGLEVGDPQHVADAQPGHVGLDRLGHGGHLGLDIELVQVLVGDAALADPGSLPDQAHRHLDVDLLAPADLDEVDVDVVALDRVALDLLGQGQVLVAADLQRDQHVGAGVGAQGLAELAGVDAQVPGLGAVAVQHGRDPAGGPQAAGGPLPGVRAVLGGQLVLGHGGRASSERVGAHSDARPGPGTTARVAVLRR